MSESVRYPDYPSTKPGQTHTVTKTVVEAAPNGTVPVGSGTAPVKTPPGTTDVYLDTVCGRFLGELEPRCKSKVSTKGETGKKPDPAPSHHTSTAEQVWGEDPSQRPFSPTRGYPTQPTQPADGEAPPPHEAKPTKAPASSNKSDNTPNTSSDNDKERKRIEWLSILFNCSMNPQKWNPVYTSPAVLDQYANCSVGLGVHLGEWVRLQGSVGMNPMDLYTPSATDPNISSPDPTKIWGLSFSLGALAKLPMIHPRFEPIVSTALQPRILFPEKGDKQWMMSLQLLAGFSIVLVPKIWELDIFAGGNITLKHPPGGSAGSYALHTPVVGIQTLFRF